MKELLIQRVSTAQIPSPVASGGVTVPEHDGVQISWSPIGSFFVGKHQIFDLYAGSQRQPIEGYEQGSDVCAFWAV